MMMDQQVLSDLVYYEDTKDYSERWYFCNVVATIAPVYLDNLVKRETKLRVDDNVLKEEESQVVDVCPEVLSALST